MLDADTFPARDDGRAPDTPPPETGPPETGPPTGEPEAGSAASPRRGRRRGVLLGGAAVLVIGAGAGWYAAQQNESPATTSNSSLPTASVVRTNLTKTLDIDGTLGYGESLRVLGGGSGRLTWLPKVGDVIERGDRAYRVDGTSIPLFYGAAPLWRTLSQGVASGSDVLLLEQNLKALGYADGVTVDRTYTWATARAVRKWQKAQGRAQTGTVGLDDAVVQPAAIRVTKVEAVLGGSPGGTLYTASDTRKVVSVNVPVNEAQAVAREGAQVRVELPGGKKVAGKISGVGTVATSASGSQAQTGQGTETATVLVTITLDKKSSEKTLDGAPVTVGFSSSERENVLAVPVNALLATTDKDYAVRVVDANGTVRTVAVQLGIFDGDNVEVTGDLSEGMKVQVPPS
ncbi:efflux RND transporter periplasmic adaptor subunit [Actinoplanes sp. NPDC020271]|uniref:efflux RND transporter periplasmic adaptor subunit n=1 Tax=Actinoplanes sp. NPDC020271 TaxID=3363896 RepID=UPI00378BE511